MASSSSSSSRKISKPIKIGHDDVLKDIALRDDELAVDKQMVMVHSSVENMKERPLKQWELNMGLTPPGKLTHRTKDEDQTQAVGFIYMVRTRDDGKTRIAYVVTSAAAVPDSYAVWVSKPGSKWPGQKIIGVHRGDDTDIAILMVETYPMSDLPEHLCPISAYRENEDPKLRVMGYTADAKAVMVARATFEEKYMIRSPTPEPQGSDLQGSDPRVPNALIPIHLGAPVLTSTGNVCGIVIAPAYDAKNVFALYEFTTNQLRDMHYFDDTNYDTYTEPRTNPFGLPYHGWEQREHGRWRNPESPGDLDPDTAVRNSPASAANAMDED